jgi:Uma2 family endonuclease
MSTSDTTDKSHQPPAGDFPVTLPVTIEQYSELVGQGHFTNVVGKVELINGRIVRMNPQGPEHACPLDILAEWSVEQVKRQFWVRIEKPIELTNSISSPEPDIAWVKRQSYAQRHPVAEDVLLLIEASVTSAGYDTGEKCDVYARAGIPEYWQINVPLREVRIYRDPNAGAFRTMTTYAMDESISPLCLPAAVLPIASLFGSS